MEPRDIQEVYRANEELAGLPAPWAICGGWAIDLYLDEVTRPHKDVDIAIRRSDQILFQEHLMGRGWQLDIAENGLHAWHPGDYLALPAHTIWCRRRDEFLELLFDEWDDQVFRYRKKQSITLPADRATVLTRSGFRALAPVIVLLYKSNDPENKDYQCDFDNAYPRLSTEGKEWLKAAIKDCHANHPWLNIEQ